jgi:hypothetical protein
MPIVNFDVLDTLEATVNAGASSLIYFLTKNNNF